MKKYQYDLCKMISILLLAGSSLSAAGKDPADPFELDFPKYLERKGLPRPEYNQHVSRGENDPILKYDLSDENIETMRLQYQVAANIEKLGEMDLALRHYWDLAEKGYAPANNRLFEAFRDGSLGLKEDVFVAGFYRDRPRTIESMKEQQKSMQRWLMRRQKQQQEGLAADAIHASPLSLADIDLHVVGEESQSLLPKKGYPKEAAGLRRRNIAAY